MSQKEIQPKREVYEQEFYIFIIQEGTSPPSKDGGLGFRQSWMEDRLV